MKNVHIPGAQAAVGQSQGYQGVSVLYTTEEVLGVEDVPVWKVAYRPDPREIQRLVEGGCVILTIVGNPPISPHRLEVSST